MAQINLYRDGDGSVHAIVVAESVDELTEDDALALAEGLNRKTVVALVGAHEVRWIS